MVAGASNGPGGSEPPATHREKGWGTESLLWPAICILDAGIQASPFTWRDAMSHPIHGYAAQTDVQEVPPTDAPQVAEAGPEPEARRPDDPYAEVAH